jgi:plastocyanin
MNCPCLTAPLSFDVFSRFGLESEGSQFTDPVLERVDKQLLAMIEDAKSRLNGDTYTVANQLQIHGFSSSAIFADTFAALHPEHVKALSSGGNGIAFLPLAEVNKDIPTYGDADQRTIPWPFGTGDFSEVAEKEFNKDAWMETNQFRYIGAQDQDPSNPDRYNHKAWKNHDLVTEIFGKSQVDDRFRTSQAIYNHLNVPATFTIYEGVGHKTPEKGRTEIARYHANQITEEFDVVHLVPDLSATEITAGDSLTVTVTAENATQLDVTNTVKLGIDGTTVSENTRKIPGGSSSEYTFTHTFDKPGTYTIKINGHQVGDNPIKVIDPTPTSTSTTTSPATEATTTGSTGPGLGIGTALASLAGIGLLTKYHEDD